MEAFLISIDFAREHQMLCDFKSAGRDFTPKSDKTLGWDGSQKPKLPEVYSENWTLIVLHLTRRLQNGSVAT
jgi:hypothetical protein